MLSYPDYQITSESRPPGLFSPNGAATYNSTHVLWCAIGNLEYTSALTLLDGETNTTSTLLNSFYGRNFSSINDVRVNYTGLGGDGSVWFTDSQYGQFQGFRPPSVIPNQVYRFDPNTSTVKAVADGFDESNGIEFSPDLQTVYITDTGSQHVHLNTTRPATIYAFNISDNGYQLTNRRVFAYSGAATSPDGIHTDVQGNVWSTYGNATAAWDPQGNLLGELRVDTVVNNFAFTPDGIVILANSKLWLVRCAVQGRENDFLYNRKGQC